MVLQSPHPLLGLRPAECVIGSAGTLMAGRYSKASVSLSLVCVSYHQHASNRDTERSTELTWSSLSEFWRIDDGVLRTADADRNTRSKCTSGYAREDTPTLQESRCLAQEIFRATSYETVTSIVRELLTDDRGEMRGPKSARLLFIL